MRYLKDIIIKNKYMMTWYLISGVLISFLTNYNAKCFQQVINGFDTNTLSLEPIIFYGCVLAFHYIVEYLDEYPAKKLENGIYLDFKLLSLKKVSKIDYQKYQTLGTGKLIQRIENGSEAGRNILFNFGLSVVRQQLPTIGFSICFIWKINKVMTLILLIGYIVVFIITNLLLKLLYQLKERIMDNEEKLNHYLVRGFMEMVLFRCHQRFPNEIKKAEAYESEIVNNKVKINIIHEAFFTIFALLVAMIDVGVIIFAWKTGDLSVGEVVALMTLINNAYTPIAIFNVLFVQYKLDTAAYKKLEVFLDLEDDVQLKTGVALNGCEGGIIIDNLSFDYGSKMVLRHIDLTIKPGEKVALVGASGSGKTTLIKLLAGLLKYESGSILLDGKELSHLCLESLYENISYISQDTPVFDGTVKENIIFDAEIADNRILAILEHVQLQSVVSRMKEGLETAIGEKGILLSGGEKQRLALARLWFHKNNLVYLDEVTSSMDNITEEQVMQAVLEFLKEKTVIAVAHRLNAIKAFDKIVVFNDGVIVGTGTFKDLMQSNAYFIELYNSCQS